jgi:hypothetical protein
MKGQINWRTITGALVMGLCLGYGLQEYVSSRPQEMVSQSAPVVVARTNISPGTVLRRGRLDVVQWPKEFLPPQSATTIPEVEGRMAINFITKGEPVLLPKLVPLDNLRHKLKIKIMAWRANILAYPSRAFKEGQELIDEVAKILKQSSPLRNVVAVL